MLCLVQCPAVFGLCFCRLQLQIAEHFLNAEQTLRRRPVVREAVLWHAGTVNDAELAAPAATEVAKNPGPRIVYPSVSALPRIYRSIANPPSSSFPHQPRAPSTGM